MKLTWGSAVLVAFVISVAAFAPLPASASGGTYPMFFPVVGENHYSDTFGAPRSGGRTHEGIDIMAAKMTPVVAVADGTVGWMHDEQGGNCCAMALNHDDGWTSWYIHLNNDTPGTDDGQGWGFAPGIETGVHVRAGQLIGWVGDSGNAEWTASHLHFELHEPGNVVINPYPSLLDATILDAPVPDDFTPPFWDDDGSVHEGNINALVDRGIAFGCAPDQYCPNDPMLRTTMAVYLARALDLPPTDVDFFTDDNGSEYEAEINSIAAAGITLGCDEGLYCPDRPVTRGQMASFLVRAFTLPSSDTNFFTDDDTSVHHDNINALAEAGVTVGCEEGLYCVNQWVTRGQMASFIERALEFVEGS